MEDTIEEVKQLACVRLFTKYLKMIRIYILYSLQNVSLTLTYKMQVLLFQCKYTFILFI